MSDEQREKDERVADAAMRTSKYDTKSPSSYRRGFCDGAEHGRHDSEAYRAGLRKAAEYMRSKAAEDIDVGLRRGFGRIAVELESLAGSPPEAPDEARRHIAELVRILDSDELQGTMQYAAVHGWQVTVEVSERNHASIEAARAFLASAPPAAPREPELPNRFDDAMRELEQAAQELCCGTGSAVDARKRMNDARKVVREIARISEPEPPRLTPEIVEDALRRGAKNAAELDKQLKRVFTLRPESAGLRLGGSSESAAKEAPQPVCDNWPNCTHCAAGLAAGTREAPQRTREQADDSRRVCDWIESNINCAAFDRYDREVLRTAQKCLRGAAPSVTDQRAPDEAQRLLGEMVEASWDSSPVRYSRALVSLPDPDARRRRDLEAVRAATGCACGSAIKMPCPSCERVVALLEERARVVLLDVAKYVRAELDAFSGPDAVRLGALIAALEDGAARDPFEKALEQVLAVVDGPWTDGAFQLAWVHGYRVPPEVSDANGAAIEAAYRLLGRERPKR